MTFDARSAKSREAAVSALVEKALLSLHGASDLDGFWKATQKLIQTVISPCRLGITIEDDPVLQTPAWTQQIPAAAFASGVHTYFETHPRSKFVQNSDFFTNRGEMKKSPFYQRYMAPHQCLYCVLLVFWNTARMLCLMTVMRTKKQGDVGETEIKTLRRLYPQLETALRRLHAREREHLVRAAFEELLSGLPLPALLLQWDLKVVYENAAAREFCALWERGPDLARVLKTSTRIPAEILEGCRNLKHGHVEMAPRGAVTAAAEPEIVRNGKWPRLRATIRMRRLGSTGLTRPYFLIDCETLQDPAETEQARKQARLPHMIRLTNREQEVTRLVCEGRSNQEIADHAGLSVPTVKKHLHAIFRKLDVGSRSRLMALMR
jgi:DNA-binding CsgD family transcriptional regulator